AARPASSAAVAVRRAGSPRPAPKPNTSAVAAMANTPDTVSCQLAGNTATGASVKNVEACVARRIAFHATGPAPAATAAPTIVATRRGRTSATSTAAATPDRTPP